MRMLFSGAVLIHYRIVVLSAERCLGNESNDVMRDPANHHSPTGKYSTGDEVMLFKHHSLLFCPKTFTMAEDPKANAVGGKKT